VADTNIIRLTINLEDYVVKIAEQKAKYMFNADISSYINWLIRSNNKREIRKKVLEIEASLEEIKPDMSPNTSKIAMYDNLCKFCNKEIYAGDEICRAEGYENYIHKKCCKRPIS
jgi:hypothetical protein